MNSEQKIAYQIVQAYKLKNYFWNTHYQNSDFKAIGERDFSWGTKKSLDTVRKTMDFVEILNEIGFKDMFTKKVRSAAYLVKGMKNKVRFAA